MPFVKGKSGNPSGRPKTSFDVQALARLKTANNIDRIIQLADSAMDESVRLRASEILHKIAYGNYVQAVTGANGGPLILQHEAGKSLIDILRKS